MFTLLSFSHKFVKLFHALKDEFIQVRPLHRREVLRPDAAGPHLTTSSSINLRRLMAATVRGRLG
jgi:hypothetical protein